MPQPELLGRREPPCRLHPHAAARRQPADSGGDRRRHARLGDHFIPDIDNTFVAKDPEHYHYWFPPTSIVAFMLNLETPNAANNKAFNDINFRRAVSMPLDRKSIIDIAGYGYPVINEDPSVLANFTRPWSDPAVIEAFGQFGKFDLEAAKALLDESGYVDKDGDGFRDNPDGSRYRSRDRAQWLDRLDRCRQIAIEGCRPLGVNAKMGTPEESVWAGT